MTHDFDSSFAVSKEPESLTLPELPDNSTSYGVGVYELPRDIDEIDRLTRGKYIYALAAQDCLPAERWRVTENRMVASLNVFPESLFSKKADTKDNMDEYQVMILEETIDKIPCPVEPWVDKMGEGRLFVGVESPVVHRTLYTGKGWHLTPLVFQWGEHYDINVSHDLRNDVPPTQQDTDASIVGTSYSVYTPGECGYNEISIWNALQAMRTWLTEKLIDFWQSGMRIVNVNGVKPDFDSYITGGYLDYADGKESYADGRNLMRFIRQFPFEQGSRGPGDLIVAPYSFDTAITPEGKSHVDHRLEWMAGIPMDEPEWANRTSKYILERICFMLKGMSLVFHVLCLPPQSMAFNASVQYCVRALVDNGSREWKTVAMLTWHSSFQTRRFSVKNIGTLTGWFSFTAILYILARQKRLTGPHRYHRHMEKDWTFVKPAQLDVPVTHPPRELNRV